jgi:hypothetical protein
MKKIKILLILFCFSWCFFLASQLKAQEASGIARINEIADKDLATYADGVYFLVLLLGKTPVSFNENLDILNQNGITLGIVSEENSPLNKGAFSLMMARHLNLNDSLLYKIFKSKRYAFRACVANGLMSENGSEWDKISGGELIEIVTKVSDLTGGNE